MFFKKIAVIAITCFVASQLLVSIASAADPQCRTLQDPDGDLGDWVCEDKACMSEQGCSVVNENHPTIPTSCSCTAGSTN